jgi:hypothetical protein
VLLRRHGSQATTFRPKGDKSERRRRSFKIEIYSIHKNISYYFELFSIYSILVQLGPNLSHHILGDADPAHDLKVISDSARVLIGRGSMKFSAAGHDVVCGDNSLCVRR